VSLDIECSGHTKQIKSFTVAGAFKRGWTSWLSEAVNKRVTAMTPSEATTLIEHFASLQKRSENGEENPPYTVRVGDDGDLGGDRRHGGLNIGSGIWSSQNALVPPLSGDAP
jgi:hypothetical protein